jgi:hypothetical protein
MSIKLQHLNYLVGLIGLKETYFWEGAMIFTLGCLSVLFGVLAMLWADGRLAHGFLHSLFPG